jgi:DNA-binding NarL/FixJ family response regulator
MTCPNCGSAVTATGALPDELGATILNRMNNRERAILRMVVEGLPNAVIADRLQSTEESVKTTLSHIMRKCEAATRIHLAVFAVRHGMVIL